MASSFSEAVEFVKYGVAHTVIIRELDPCYALARDILSSPFSAAEDPNPPQFQFQLNFREKYQNMRPPILYPSIACFLKLAAVTTVNQVCIAKCKFTATSTELKPIITGSVDGRRVVSRDLSAIVTLGGLKKTCQLPSSVCVKCELEYYGPPIRVGVPTIPKSDPNLRHDLLKLLHEEDAAEVTIFVRDEEFKAHRAILGARSDYFRTMFDSGLQESRTNELTIEEADPEMFSELLDFIYSGLAPKNLRDIAESLLPLADRFGIVALKNMCASALAIGLCPENAIGILLLAESHGCPDLVERCIPVIRRNSKTLKATDDWQDLKKNPDLFASVFECSL